MRGPGLVPRGELRPAAGVQRGHHRGVSGEPWSAGASTRRRGGIGTSNSPCLVASYSWAGPSRATQPSSRGGPSERFAPPAGCDAIPPTPSGALLHPRHARCNIAPLRPASKSSMNAWFPRTWRLRWSVPGRAPKKEIARALKRAVRAGLLVIEIHNGHRWGEVMCEPCSAKRSVYCTPRDPGTHAKQVDRFTAQHTHPRRADAANRS